MLDHRIISIKKPHLRALIRDVLKESPPFTGIELDQLLDALSVDYYDRNGDHERAAIIWCDIKESKCQR